MKLKIFFANFQILGPLGCQGWVVIPQNVKKKSKSLHPNAQSTPMTTKSVVILFHACCFNTFSYYFLTVLTNIYGKMPPMFQTCAYLIKLSWNSVFTMRPTCGKEIFLASIIKFGSCDCSANIPNTASTILYSVYSRYSRVPKVRFSMSWIFVIMDL